MGIFAQAEAFSKCFLITLLLVEEYGVAIMMSYLYIKTQEQDLSLA